MLKRITSITADEGVFKEFSWGKDCPDFTERNVIYGLNATGKTILSHLLSCKEDQKEINHKGMSLSVGFEVDARGEQEEEIALFSQEYIEKNFYLEKDPNQKIKRIILGEPQKKLLNSIEKMQQKITTLEKAKRSIYEDGMKNIAGNIKGFFRGKQYEKHSNIANYEKSKMNRDLNTFQGKIEDEILDSIQYTNFEQDIDRRSDDFMNEISYLEEINYDEVAGRLSLIPEGIPYERIVGMEDKISNWVKLGLEIHNKKKEKCEFCENEISSRLIQKLEKHFNQDANDLIHKLERDSRHLEQLKGKIDLCNTRVQTLSFFDSDQKIRMAAIKHIFDENIMSYFRTIDNLINKIESKKSQIYNTKEEEPILIEKLNAKQAYINSLIKNINEMILIFNRNQSMIIEKMNIAGKKLIFHKIAEGMKDFYENRMNFEEINCLCEDNFSKIKPCQTIAFSIQKTLNSIDEKRKDIYNISKFTKEINVELNKFFGNGVLQLKITDDEISGYEIIRNDKKARIDSLSEGEINVIVFLYFLFSLERTDEQGKKLTASNTRIIIDDPTSSLDAINFYGIFITMKERISSAKQVFILTHDLDFLERIIYWLKRYAKNKKYKENKKNTKDEKPNIKNHSFYMLDKGINLKTKIILMPKAIENSTALFPYLFKKLNALKDEIESEDECIGAPNLVRQFLEMYVNIWNTKGDSLENSLKNLWKEQEKSSVETILQYLNSSVHPNSDAKAAKSFLFLRNNLTKIFEMIKKHDKTFHNTILNSVKNGIQYPSPPPDEDNNSLD